MSITPHPVRAYRNGLCAGCGMDLPEGLAQACRQCGDPHCTACFDSVEGMCIGCAPLPSEDDHD